MATQRTLQLVARLPSSVMAAVETAEGAAVGGGMGVGATSCRPNIVSNGGCRSIVISHLKPIVIEPPRPSGQNQIVLLDSDESSDYESVLSAADACPRKRARLSNLTNEEKILRRKLKNRVSAQTARDRKKQRMAELEEAIMSLQQRNKMLEAENHSLKIRADSLMKENKDLRQQLQGSPVTSMEAHKPAVIIESSKPQVIHVQKKRKLDIDETPCLTSSGRVILRDVQILPKPPSTTDSSRPPAALPKVVSISSIQKVLGKRGFAGVQVPRVTIVGSDASSGKQPCESAALTRLPPPQQELLCLMVFQLVAVIFFTHWMSLGVTMSMAFLKKDMKAEDSIESSQASLEVASSKRKSRRLRRWEKKPSTLKRWWGRHQKNWNPSMNS